MIFLGFSAKRGEHATKLISFLEGTRGGHIRELKGISVRAAELEDIVCSMIGFARRAARRTWRWTYWILDFEKSTEAGGIAKAGREFCS